MTVQSMLQFDVYWLASILGVIAPFGVKQGDPWR